MPVGQDFFRGAMGVDDRISDIHPEDWGRQEIYDQMPVGKAPMTAMLMSMGSQSTSSRRFHWWQQGFNNQRGSVTDVKLDAGFVNPYVSGGVAGDDLFIQMAQADIEKVNKGDILMVVSSTNVFRSFQVDTVFIAGANSFVGAELLEADTGNALAGTSLTFMLIGSAQPELSELPDAIFEEPTEYSNYAQIFMESIEISGTELAEMSRVTPDVLARAREKAFMRFRNKMEWNYIFGQFGTATGANGKTIWRTRGIRTAINENVSGNIVNYQTDSTDPGGSSIAGKSWLAGGMGFIETYMELLSRYSDAPTKKAYCGSQAWLALNQLVLDQGHYQIEQTTDEFGIRVLRIHGLIQTLDIIQHPLFTENPALRRSMLIVEPELLKYRPMEGRDVQFVAGADTNKDGWNWKDGIKEGWWAQAGLQYDNLDAMGWVDNLGLANTAS